MRELALENLVNKGQRFILHHSFYSLDLLLGTGKPQGRTLRSGESGYGESVGTLDPSPPSLLLWGIPSHHLSHWLLSRLGRI